MDENFLRVLFPGRFRVLGRWLPPLSHWHLACLAALGSPFISQDREIILADVQLAVKVALTRWPAAPDLRPTLRDAWQRWRHEDDEPYVRAHADVFAAWRAAHELRPEFWEREDSNARLLTAPDVLIRVAQLERLTKFTHGQSWNDVTPGYAAWLVATINEQEGAELRFLREDDDEDDGLPDLTTMSEDELCAYLAADLGAAEANAFMQRRADLRASGHRN